MNKEEKLRMRTELLNEISIKDKEGLWHNKIPAYKEQLVDRIKGYLNTTGNKIAQEAKRGGWLSVNGKVGYVNYEIPDRACETLVGYLNLVLKRQYFLFYGINYGWETEFMLTQVRDWLISKRFEEEMFSNSICPQVIVREEHLQLIRARGGII